MRISPGIVVNAAAWVALLVLAIMAAVMAAVLGPVGLLLVGLLTVFVCSQFALDEHVPTWGSHVFRARMESGGSPEMRAERAAERQASFSPLRFYRWCGIALIVAGVAGLASQVL